MTICIGALWPVGGGGRGIRRTHTAGRTGRQARCGQRREVMACPGLVGTLGFVPAATHIGKRIRSGSVRVSARPPRPRPSFAFPGVGTAGDTRRRLVWRPANKATAVRAWRFAVPRRQQWAVAVGARRRTAEQRAGAGTGRRWAGTPLHSKRCRSEHDCKTKFGI